MAITITAESKNNVTITNEDKSGGANIRWLDADWSWDEARGTWEQSRYTLDKEDKNNVTITNESKS